MTWVAHNTNGLDHWLRGQQKQPIFGKQAWIFTSFTLNEIRPPLNACGKNEIKSIFIVLLDQSNLWIKHYCVWNETFLLSLYHNNSTCEEWTRCKWLIWHGFYSIFQEQTYNVQERKKKDRHSYKQPYTYDYTAKKIMCYLDQQTSQAVFLYYCPNCPTHLNNIDWVISTIWVAVKKYGINH